MLPLSLCGVPHAYWRGVMMRRGLDLQGFDHGNVLRGGGWLLQHQRASTSSEFNWALIWPRHVSKVHACWRDGSQRVTQNLDVHVALLGSRSSRYQRPQSLGRYQIHGGTVPTLLIQPTGVRVTHVHHNNVAMPLHYCKHFWRNDWANHALLNIIGFVGNTQFLQQKKFAHFVI